MSLQYVKKETKDGIDFFHADKLTKFPTSWFQHFGHQGFL